MGNTPLSKINSSSCVNCIDDYEEEVNVYPDFYQKDPVITPEDLDSVRKSWRKIVDGTSENFTVVQGTGSVKHNNGSEWFGEIFYFNLFEAHPAAQFLFSPNLTRQIKLFTRKLSELLDMMERPNDIHMTLMDIAVKHSKYGVHAIQYGIFGRVLLNTLRSCLQEEYTDYVNQSWIKVYSFILSVVVPIALAEDRQQLWSSFPRSTLSATSASQHTNTTKATIPESIPNGVKINNTVSSISVNTTLTSIGEGEETKENGISSTSTSTCNPIDETVIHHQNSNAITKRKLIKAGNVAL